MERILVTGACGFIGAKLVQQLVSSGYPTCGICRRLTIECKENFICCETSILDKEQIEKIIIKFNPTVVVHLAAIAFPAYYDNIEIYNVNVLGTEQLLKTCREFGKEVKRFVFVSTAGVYGAQSKQLVDEGSIPWPINHYSYSKLIGEMILHNYEDFFEVRIVRPFNIIGVGQKPIFLVPKLAKAFAERAAVLQVGNIQTYRDYMDVEMASKILCKVAIGKDWLGGVLNLCSGVATSGIELIRKLTAISGYCPKIEVNNQFVRNNEIFRLVGDQRKLKKFAPEVENAPSIDEVLLKIYNSYK